MLLTASDDRYDYKIDRTGEEFRVELEDNSMGTGEVRVMYAPGITLKRNRLQLLDFDGFVLYVSGSLKR